MLDSTHPIEQIWVYVTYNFIVCVASPFSIYLDFTLYINQQLWGSLQHVAMGVYWVLYHMSYVMLLFYVTNTTNDAVSINLTTNVQLFTLVIFFSETCNCSHGAPTDASN